MVKKAAAILLALILLFPIYMMIQGSLQPMRYIISIPPRVFPTNPSLENYMLFGELQYLWRWVLNSVFIVAMYMATGILVNGLAGYAFSFARFKGKQVVFWMFLATLLVSRSVLLIPQYVVVRQLELTGFLAVTLMYAFSAGYMYLFRNYFDGMPKSIMESARIDGAGDGKIFRSIILPLSKPVIAAVLVMRGIEALTDYIWQVLNLTRETDKTMLVGFTQSINRISKWGLKGRDVGFELAVGVVLMIPLLLVFAFTSKYFIKGVTLGGEK